MIAVRSRRGRPAAGPRVLAAAAAVTALALGGCGGSSSGTPGTASASSTASPATIAAPALLPDHQPVPPLAAPRLAQRGDVTLVLDFVPNAVHAGIYRALAAGYYADLNIALHIVQPTSTSDTLKLIDAGRAQFGLADGLDVAQLVDAGGDAESIMAITQRPLGGLIALASQHLSSPRALAGRTVGITGVPSDQAVLDTEVRAAGGNPAAVHVVNIGFSGAAAVASGRVAAFTGYWPDDGVQLQVAGHPTTVFRLDSYGGPSYPGLQLFTTKRLGLHNPALVRAFLAATVRGYQDTLADPARSVNELIALNPGLSRPFTTASLHAYLPLFRAGGAPLGTLSPAHLAALSSWMLAHGLIHHAIAPARLATNAYLPRSGR